MTSGPTAPGVAIFSDEWLGQLIDKKSPLYYSVKEICSSYQLGNSVDPKLISDMIINGFRTYMKEKKTVDRTTGDGVYPSKFTATSCSVLDNGEILICGVFQDGEKAILDIDELS